MPQKAQEDLETIQGEVLEIINERVEDTEIGLHDNLLESGVDSLIAAQIVAALEIRFDLELVEEFFARPTAADISKVIDAGGSVS